MGKITNITTEWVVGQATNNGMRVINNFVCMGKITNITTEDVVGQATNNGVRLSIISFVWEK
jgi:polygalacturonase